MRPRNIRPLLGACVAGALVAACGGGSGNGGSGSLTLGVTDSPVDGAREIQVAFTGVTLKPAGGPAEEHTFDAPRTVNLLGLTGSTREKLLDGVSVEAGKYNWIRLEVLARKGTTDSFIRLKDGQKHSL
ncbi:MAG TPA: DUF4382 domain-containing protein, partial [Gammaproteobacteria bacterium]|nr:DUF4382 domain-containing protein [Gammaproteobacteria bacterium]